MISNEVPASNLLGGLKKALIFWVCVIFGIVRCQKSLATRYHNKVLAMRKRKRNPIEMRFLKPACCRCCWIFIVLGDLISLCSVFPLASYTHSYQPNAY